MISVTNGTKFFTRASKACLDFGPAWYYYAVLTGDQSLFRSVELRLPIKFLVLEPGYADNIKEYTKHLGDGR
jgi:hypothetical protein